MDEGLPFTKAALAGGVKPSQLRGWLDRKLVALDSEDGRERTSTSKREFSVADAMRIAWIGELLRHGVPLENAGKMIETAINFDLMVSDGAAPAEVAASFAGQIMVVWLDRRDGRWMWAIEPHVQVNAPALIRIDLGAVARGVAGRLAAA